MNGNILIVEDNQENGAWLSNLVCKIFPESYISLCKDSRTTLDYLSTKRPQLALIDINLPDGSGLNLIKPVLKSSPQAHVAMITILDDQDHVLKAIQLGATGYLLKDLSEHSFLHKLKGIIAGEPPLSPSVARLILQHCAASTENAILQTKPAQVPPAEGNLTHKETEVLVLISKGFSRKESANFMNISENTIATHIRNIYRKLDVSSRAEAALIASRMGLISTDIY
ncbi:MAG: response regulator transcription factor [Thiolinea sp.]